MERREMERREMEREMEGTGTGLVYNRSTRIPARRSSRPPDPPTFRVLPQNLAPGPPNPPTALVVQHELIPVGIDLICNGCQHHVPGSQELSISYHFYERYIHGPRMRCFTNCLNCGNEWELIQLCPDYNFAVRAGATQHFPAAENVPLTSDDGPLVL